MEAAPEKARPARGAAAAAGCRHKAGTKSIVAWAKMEEGNKSSDCNRPRGAADAKRGDDESPVSIALASGKACDEGGEREQAPQ